MAPSLWRKVTVSLPSTSQNSRTWPLGVLSTRRCGLLSCMSLASVGISVVPPGADQNVPTQIGLSRLPSSYSIHTLDCTSGTKNRPCSAAPPNGRQGHAQSLTHGLSSSVGGWSSSVGNRLG